MPSPAVGDRCEALFNKPFVVRVLSRPDILALGPDSAGFR